MKQKKGLNILITAGPTREPIDPVRFISNYSTGFLGYTIAQTAKKRGHRVVLISGPTLLAKPSGVRLIEAATAQKMQRELKRRFSWCDCLIMTAAVGDFRAKRVSTHKLKRNKSRKGIALKLEQNPDIVAGLSRRKGKRLVVGFALETESLERNARHKLKAKNLDLIIATQMNTNSYPFGSVRIRALVMDKKARIQRLNQTTKIHLARILLDSIEKAVL